MVKKGFLGELRFRKLLFFPRGRVIRGYRRLYREERNKRETVLSQFKESKAKGSLKGIQSSVKAETKLTQQEYADIFNLVYLNSRVVYDEITGLFNTLLKGRQKPDQRKKTLEALSKAAAALRDTINNIRGIWSSALKGEAKRMATGTIKLIDLEGREISQADLEERRVQQCAGSLKSVAKRILKSDNVDASIKEFNAIMKEEIEDMLALHKNLDLILNHIDERHKGFVEELRKLMAEGFPENLLKKDMGLEEQVEAEEKKDEQQEVNDAILLFRMLRDTINDANEQLKSKEVMKEAA